MFEGLVHRVLVGYLGRYFKNIQKEQLKLSLWNEEVLLENVDLIPEAFDYLQLPFSIKQGRVGRLSIKLSWKKIGWDHPIIIAVEDVFICLSQRDDQEWNLDAVERREFAAKKAQLAAAELSKLSKRICDNQAGKSFISYITAKVLDSIQLSIRNFHVQYGERQFDSAQVLFGLQFSNLTVKQNLAGSFGAKMVGGQVNKTASIEGLEIYCTTSKGDIDSMGLDDADSKSWCSARHGGNEFDYLLQPLNVSVSLGVNKAGKLDTDLPQYSIRADLNDLAVSLNEIQLQRILVLSDYLSTSSLREKYGRYRPWGCPLSRKQDGWQRLWWKYAQESILADVRLKLKKTSWRYLGQRLSFRRKYINLYQTKLEFLHQEQAIDEYIIQDLEQMEKESDIDDILSYRSVAELKLQEVLSTSLSSNMEVKGAHSFIEKSQNDERSSSRSRGWLNWISRGMLGAGGTDDSIQFSGVVSDEVVKDIYEATEFQPSVLSSGDVDANYKMFTCAMKFNVGCITAKLQSKSHSKKIADLIFNELVIECKLWEELAMVVCHFRSGEMFDPCNKRAILQIGTSLTDGNVREDEPPSCRFQVDMSPKRDIELSVKVMLQPLEVSCDIEFFQSLWELFTVLNSFEFQLERVLWSLNGIEDVRTRLLSKVEYILSSHKKLSWDVNVINIIINVPWSKATPEEYKLVLKLESLFYTSKFDVDSIASIIEEQSSIPKRFSSSISASNILTGFQVQDLYNYFEVKLSDIELILITPQHAQAISILEKFCASVTLASCIISDQSVLKQLEVYVNLSALNASFSPPIYESFVAFIAQMENLCSRSEPLLQKKPTRDVFTNQPGAPGFGFGFSFSARLDLVSFCFDLANDGENSSELMFSLQGLDMWFSHTQFDECWVCTKALKITTSPLRGVNDGRILCLSGKHLSSSSANHEDLGIRHGNQDGNLDHSLTEVCFILHNEAYRRADTVVNKCTVCLNDIDFHCYPYIVGLLVGFYDKLSAYGSPFTFDNSFSPDTDAKSPGRMAGLEFERFGYSNFIETGSSDHASISLDNYPFVTLCNSASLGSLESSLHYPFADWRRLFNLRERKIKSTKFCVKNGLKAFYASPLTFTSVVDTIAAPVSISDANLLNIDINLCGVRVHFHDSSCIVGTVALPTLKAAQKGIVAFTFDDQSVARMEKQQKGAASHSNGVINEVLEGLTGLLQSPIKEAEKHGLPGVLSGIAFGVAGLVARPAASILEVTGKTAQSIRNRSRLYQMGPQCFRVRLPRPLSRELPLRPYSLEEAVGTSVLMEADVGLNLKNEVLVMCKSLKQAGKFVVVTERLVLTVSSPGLVDLGKPEFRGVPIDPEWLVESEISLDSVIHADAEEEVVHIVGTRSDAELKKNQHQSKKGVLTRTKSWNSPISLPLSLTKLELASMKDAKELLQILLSMIAQGKERRPGSGYVLHRSDIM